MLIEVRKIPNGERIFESKIEIDGKEIPLKLKTERNFADILCLAEYETEIDCECSRCLENFKQKIKGAVRFFIVPKSKSDFDGEDFDCYFYKSENDKIDFSQTIFDDIWTQIPMKPLCNEECAGIILEENSEKPDLCGIQGENRQWKAALEKIKNKN